MPFCPRCRCEYNVGVEQCIDCKVPLVLHRPIRRELFDIDTDELLVPIGAFFCLLAALGLLALRYAATAGQLQEPLGTMIASQPVCMVGFYIIAAVLSGLILSFALFRWLFMRR